MEPLWPDSDRRALLLLCERRLLMVPYYPLPNPRDTHLLNHPSLRRSQSTCQALCPIIHRGSASSHGDGVSCDEADWPLTTGYGYSIRNLVETVPEEGIRMRNREDRFSQELMSREKFLFALGLAGVA